MNPGYNYRLDELHAALGRAQLKKLERNNQRRRNLLGDRSTAGPCRSRTRLSIRRAI